MDIVMSDGESRQSGIRITYTAPNRAHHYPYAVAFAKAGVLHRFVCGFPRWSPRADEPVLAEYIERCDAVQTVFLASLRLRAPARWSEWLAHASKCRLDRRSRSFAQNSTHFIFYNGAGLDTARRLRGSGVVRVVEVVNSHVENQEELLAEEYRRCGLPYRGIYRREKLRRVAEYEEADFILCPSGFARQSFLDRGFEPERIITSPYGFDWPDAGEPVEPTGHPDDRFVVLYVGTISVRKGLRYLMKAFGRLKHPRKELWIVGPQGSESGLAGVTIPENVVFKGVIKGRDLSRAYRQASVFVLPTIEDGFGLVLCEALAQGCLVIATENCGGPDLIREGEEGFIVPIRDPGAIQEKLEMVADDPGRLAAMKEAAFARSRRLGGWAEIGRQLVEQLESVLHRARA